jgi:hypothetical protein
MSVNERTNRSFLEREKKERGKREKSGPPVASSGAAAGLVPVFMCGHTFIAVCCHFTPFIIHHNPSIN